MRGLILATIGTPQDASKESVSRYLSNFLGDSHVISIPQTFRRSLVENRIIPRHLALSMNRYQALQKLFGGEMPLRRNMENVVQKMRLRFPDWKTYSLQLYGGEREVEQLLQEMSREGEFKEITILPLYPQCTVSSYRAVVDKARKALHKQFPEATLHVVPPYYADDRYIALLQKRVRSFVEHNQYDLLVTSYHSIPLLHQWWGMCFGYDYHKQCHTTTKKLFQLLPEIKTYQLVFQSAMGKKWLTPFAEKELPLLPEKGISNVLVVCPGFLVDCLETVYDIGQTLRKKFFDRGGKVFDLVPALNSEEDTLDLFYALASSCQTP